jgi:hypothetical protein
MLGVAGLRVAEQPELPQQSIALPSFVKRATCELSRHPVHRTGVELDGLPQRQTSLRQIPGGLSPTQCLVDVWVCGFVLAGEEQVHLNANMVG